MGFLGAQLKACGMEGLTSLLKRTTIKGAYLAFPDVGGRQVLSSLNPNLSSKCL